MIKGFDEAVKLIQYNIRHFHLYDVDADEFEAAIRWAFDKLAKENGEPVINWEEEDD